MKRPAAVLAVGLAVISIVAFMVPMRMDAQVAPRVPGKVQVSYDVEFETTGPWENRGCSAVGGSDKLTGTISGNEPISVNQSNDYHGTLKRVTKVEYCGIRTLPSGEGKDCLTSIAGSGWFDVVLEVQAARGGYLKVKKAPGQMVSTVSGDCDPAEMVQLKIDYGSGITAGSPNGQPIAIDVRDSLRVRNLPYRATRPGDGDWTFKVVRRLP